MVAIIIIGAGLVLAPALFQMFSRAPEGRVMIDEFRPYMSVDEIGQFEGYMEQIRAADGETRNVLAPALAASGADEGAFPLVATWVDQWSDIDADMSDLLVTMGDNIDNYAAVDALPSFDLFPWFFVIPGLAIAGVGVALLRSRDPRTRTRLTWVAGGLGVALVAAPFAFQMFTRAPQGGDMIDDFRPMMVPERVQDVQGYFITMGGAEGQLRNDAVPTAISVTALNADDLPAITQFSEAWAGIVNDFAPMVATMSDNVDNFEAVAALPPFPLFPWFFVVPGVLVALLAWRSRPADDPIESTT